MYIIVYRTLQYNDLILRLIVRYQIIIIVLLARHIIPSWRSTIIVLYFYLALVANYDFGRSWCTYIWLEDWHLSTVVKIERSRLTANAEIRRKLEKQELHSFLAQRNSQIKTNPFNPFNFNFNRWKRSLKQICNKLNNSQNVCTYT